jgi:hypothetical protein
MRKFSRLLFGFSFMLLLNSCSKEATLDEVSPSSVETISELKTWATKNDKLNQANLIEWDNSIPIILPDSIKGYAAPVKTASGYKEFITFELGGKRHGWYKSYNRLNSTDMQIVIQTAEGKTLRSGFIRKKSAADPKGKSSPMREMNLDIPIDWMLLEEILGIMLEDVTVTAPRLNQGGGGFYFGNTRFDMNTFNYYFEAGFFNAGNFGGGNSQYGFVDFNYTLIEDKLTNSCFKAVLNDLRNKNVINVVGDIIRKFVNNPRSKITFNQKFEVTKTDGTQLNASFDPNTNVITLSESKLKNASKEFIAIVIIHELFHAEIRNLEQQDHTKMLNDYVIPAGAYIKELYNLDSRIAENLFISGLRGSDGYALTVFSNFRYDEINKNIYDYVQNKISGNYCN